MNRITLHPEILSKNGKKEFVVLPYEEFLALQELLEDVEDLLELRAAKQESEGEPTLSLTDAKKELGLS
ncbi:MAG TPA: hypothetical protein VGB61_13370 [Pyrinomonadaceae bacterium]|jgi:PHD/YefM family antitoxin component YafN of YafNO toxin-antitoxin module